MEEELTCPICYRIFEDPQLSPCSHNFCKQCLEGAMEGNSFFKCPTCCKEIATMGANSHQANYILKVIVEKYNKNKAVVKTPMCKVHSGQPLNIFCSSDLKLLCGICAINGEHKGHAFSSIDEAYSEEKNFLHCLLKGLEDFQLMDVLARLDTLKANKFKDLNLLKKNSDVLKDYFEKLQYLVELKKNEILSELQTMKLAVMQAYDADISKLNNTISEQKKACNIAKKIEDITDPLMFLQLMEKFRETIKLTKAPLTSASDVTFISNMKNVDTSLWDNYKLVDVDKLCLPQEAPAKQQIMQLKCPFFPMVITTAAILVLFLVVFLSEPHTNFVQGFNNHLQQLPLFLSDTTTQISVEIAFYWELVAERLILLGEKLHKYTMIFFPEFEKMFW